MSFRANTCLLVRQTLIKKGLVERKRIPCHDAINSPTLPFLLAGIALFGSPTSAEGGKILRNRKRLFRDDLDRA